jgi:ABC-2 type transport system permease protein
MSTTGGGGLRTQSAEMARRSLLQTLRQPMLIVPPIAFPLVLMAVNVGGLDAATKIPGFPTDSYLDFAIAFAFLQGSLFAMVNAGTILARDVETGFLKRLALTPMRRAALLLGNLVGVLAVSLFSMAIYLIVGFAAGMEIKAGVGGLVVLVALAVLVAVALASIGAWVGLRAGNAEAVQGFFPLFFVLFFLSSMNLPRNLIEQDWFRTIATYNPISYLVEGVRAPIIYGWDGEALAMGFGLAGLIAVLGVWGASSALRTRLVPK